MWVGLDATLELKWKREGEKDPDGTGRVRLYGCTHMRREGDL